MKTLWENDGTRTRLEQAARTYVRDLTWPKLAGEFAEFCEGVIAGHRSVPFRQT
jgi:hypothetical protein